jgi:GrpB-like predicted nucleotidyltransferase (UPF0157 family)
MITLANHDSGWPHAFSQETERLRPAFDDLLIEFHHIGSTSVPGILAKPIIDILAIVSDVDALDARAVRFEALGYEVMGEFGLPGRRYFRRDDSAGVRTHQIHSYAERSVSEIDRHLDFRDYLLAHPETARAYSNLKRRLVEHCIDDMQCYSDGKTAFIRDVEERAALWKRESNVTRRSCTGR